MNEKIESIRQKCLEARFGEFYLDSTDANERRAYVPRLSDMLIAVQKFSSPDWFEKYVIPIVDTWNLREDSLDKQSEKTVEFLYKLLKLK
jgi:hypothetical protein